MEWATKAAPSSSLSSSVSQQQTPRLNFIQSPDCPKCYGAVIELGVHTRTVCVIVAVLCVSLSSADVDPPVLSGLSPTVSIDCGENLFPNNTNLGEPVVVDNGDIVSVTFEDSGEENCAFTRTWTAEDEVECSVYN